MSGKISFADLAEKDRKDKAETPAPVAQAIATLSPTALTSGKRAAAAKPKAAAGELREKTSITLTPSAAAALRRLQTFLMVECEGSNVPTAEAVNVALELAAAGLPKNRDQLTKILAEHRQADKRRKSQ